MGDRRTILDLTSTQLIADSVLVDRRALTAGLPVFIRCRRKLIVKISLRSYQHFDLRMSRADVGLGKASRNRLVHGAILQRFPNIPDEQLETGLYYALLFRISSLTLPPTDNKVSLR